MTPLTDREVMTRHDDLEMLKRTHLWARRAIELKTAHREKFGRCQAMKDGGYRVWVYKDGSYELEDLPLMYADAEAVVDAGWRVD